MQRNENLSGDTAVRARLVRGKVLKKLSREPESLRQRILHGSDYPLPRSQLPDLFRTGLFLADRHNSLDLGWRIKSPFAIGRSFENRVRDLLRIDQTATGSLAQASTWRQQVAAATFYASV